MNRKPFPQHTHKRRNRGKIGSSANFPTKRPTPGQQPGAPKSPGCAVVSPPRRPCSKSAPVKPCRSWELVDLIACPTTHRRTAQVGGSPQPIVSRRGSRVQPLPSSKTYPTAQPVAAPVGSLLRQQSEPRPTSAEAGTLLSSRLHPPLIASRQRHAVTIKTRRVGSLDQRRTNTSRSQTVRQPGWHPCGPSSLSRKLFRPSMAIHLIQ